MDLWEVAKAIKTKFDSSTGAGSAHALTSGRLRYSMARQQDTMPYVVYTLVDDVHDWTCDDTQETLRIQFSIYSDAASAQGITQITDALTMLFDWCTLSITGFIPVYCQRDVIAPPIHEEDYWRCDIDYRMRFVQSTTTTTTTTTPAAP